MAGYADILINNRILLLSLNMVYRAYYIKILIKSQLINLNAEKHLYITKLFHNVIISKTH